MNIKFLSISLVCLTLFIGCNDITNDNIVNEDNNSLIFQGPTQSSTNLKIFKKTGESVNK
jgi:hypothetical protein